MSLVSHWPRWRQGPEAEQGSAWNSRPGLGLPADLTPHRPVAGTEVLQGTSCGFQGVEVPALRKEGEVETYHLGLVQQLKA